MSYINFKHLRYFWTVARTGSITRAADQLHLTPQSISGQLTEFEAGLGVELFRRTGRGRELTDAGRCLLGYAEEIFAISDELVDVLHDHAARKAVTFRVGIADSVSKSTAFHLIEPALGLDMPVRLVCREGRLSSLLSELAIHRLDMIVADRPMPANLNVRGFSHLLGESGMTVFATHGLRLQYAEDFPGCINEAPFLLPGEDVATRPTLIQWFERLNLRPRIVGEFDDSALMKAFGQAGVGFFVAPSALEDIVCRQHQVVAVGRVDDAVERLYAITAERRITHPAVAAVRRAAQENVFGVRAEVPSSDE